MKAAVYHGPYDIRIEEMPEPELAPGELLLEVHAAGICGTDVGEYVHGPVSYATRGHEVTGHHGPLIPGHEFSGRVVAVAPDVEGFEPGTIVASGAGISCGECWQCRAGRTNLCVRYSTVGLQRHGALAEYCAVPASTCIAIEAFGLDEETAALAQPMSIGVHAFRRGRVRPGEDVVVVGAGGIGTFLTYAAAASGASVTVVDLAPERLELASALGAANTVQANPDQTLAGVIAEHDLAPAAIYEVTGNETVFRQAFDAVPAGARLVVVGLQAEPRLVDLRSVTLREIELIGTNAHVCGDDLPEALRLLARRGSDWSDVAPTVIPLSLLVSDGLQPMAEGHSARIKTLVDPWASAPRKRALR
jgi:(R,R)-butanediol dehydrogenase / meso-butanediol dehydrogenase / diacetyl reductase